MRQTVRPPVSRHHEDVLAAEIRELRSLISGQLPKLPADAKAAVEARAVAQARGYHTVQTLAACCGIHPRTVSDRCKAGVIRTLDKGTKSYHIPLSEESRLNGTHGFSN